MALARAAPPRTGRIHRWAAEWPEPSRRTGEARPDGSDEAGVAGEVQAAADWAAAPGGGGTSLCFRARRVEEARAVSSTCRRRNRTRRGGGGGRGNPRRRRSTRPRTAGRAAGRAAPTVARERSSSAAGLSPSRLYNKCLILEKLSRMRHDKSRQITAAARHQGFRRAGGRGPGRPGPGDPTWPGHRGARLGTSRRRGPPGAGSAAATCRARLQRERKQSASAGTPHCSPIHPDWRIRVGARPAGGDLHVAAAVAALGADAVGGEGAVAPAEARHLDVHVLHPPLHLRAAGADEAAPARESWAAARCARG